MKTLVLSIIKAYQKFIPKKFLGQVFERNACRFNPTCSQYTYEAVAKYGTIKGLLLGFGRILRCHPFSKGGYDPLK